MPDGNGAPAPDAGGMPSINGSGHIAFAAGSVIYLFEGSDFIVLVDTQNQFSIVSDPGLNDEGTFAYGARILANPGDQSLTPAILTGPDPLQDLLIKAGHMIDGRTIANLSFGGLNNEGQIAFDVFFTDGTGAVMRADPSIAAVDEPAGLGLAALALLLAVRLAGRRRAA